jgi:hypothetical protein
MCMFLGEQSPYLSTCDELHNVVVHITIKFLSTWMILTQKYVSYISYILPVSYNVKWVLCGNSVVQLPYVIIGT